MAQQDKDCTKTPKEKLMVALRKGEAERVVAMMDQFPGELEPNMSADTAQNKLIHRAARYGHVKVIKTLVARGADVCIPNKFGMLPLHHGAVHGGAEVVSALLQAGADPNRADTAGRLPLHWTATKGHLQAARVLIEGGARVVGADQDGFTPLHRCCQEEPQSQTEEDRPEDYRARLDKKKAEVARLLISKGADVRGREVKGQQTGLHLAAMNGLAEVTAVLLEAGADPSAVNKIGQTPLIYAVLEQQVAVVELLIKAGADVNYGNKLHSDWAALHWAALTDDPKVVEAVLTSKTVRNVKDRSGRYPASLAREHGKFSVLQLLDKLKKV